MSSPKSPNRDLSKRQFAEISGSISSISSIVSSTDSRFIVSDEIAEGKYYNSFDNSDSNLSNKNGRNGDGYRTPPPRKFKLDPDLLVQEKHYNNKRE
jgi:hypothetical protein